MKRDLKLIRELLLIIESKGDSFNQLSQEDIPYNDDSHKYSEQSVYKHIELLNDAGFIKAKITILNDGRYASPLIGGITWQGYEFLETIRNENNFDKIKKRLGDLTSFALPIVQQLGVEFLKSQFGLNKS